MAKRLFFLYLFTRGAWLIYFFLPGPCSPFSTQLPSTAPTTLQMSPSRSCFSACQQVCSAIKMYFFNIYTLGPLFSCPSSCRFCCRTTDVRRFFSTTRIFPASNKFFLGVLYKRTARTFVRSFHSMQRVGIKRGTAKLRQGGGSSAPFYMVISLKGGMSAAQGPKPTNKIYPLKAMYFNDYLQFAVFFKVF